MNDTLLHDIRLAEERGKLVLRDQPLAILARFSAAKATLLIGLNNGVEVSVPVALIQGLADATDAQRRNIEIAGIGYGLYWPDLDLDLSVPDLLNGVTGTRRWMDQQRASLAGATITPAKADAARRNGAKGGRPRKTASIGP